MRFICSVGLSVAIIVIPGSGSLSGAGLTRDPVGFATGADFDLDGLTDELELSFRSDARNPDTDGDGYPDGLEVANGYSPTSVSPVKLTKQIVIDLGTNRLHRYLGGVRLDEHPVSPGIPKLPTPTGTFTITKKHPKAWSRASQLWMPWWLNFTGPKAPPGLYAIHELPVWPNGRREGERSLGRPASHGCVRLGIGPAKELYDWTPEGTKVIIKKSETIGKK